MPTLVVLALLLSGALPATAGPGAAPARYIVVMKPGVDAGAVARGHGAAVSHIYTHALNGFAAPLSPTRLRALAVDPRVAYVEPDLVVHTCEQTLPTGVDRIDADLNATANIDGVDDRVDVDIAIIDTGIDKDHPDLYVVGGVRFYTPATGPPWERGTLEDDNYDDDHGHGSHVAGSAAALDNVGGVVGVAPGARLWGVKVLDASGSGYLSDVIAGIDWVTGKASEIEVANMSLSWQGNSGAARTAIQNSVDAGVVYVVAAANDAEDIYGSDGTAGTSDDHEPASYPEVATISAMADSDGQPGGTGSSTSYGADDSFASFSNYSGSVVDGNPVSSAGLAIDLLMPGVDIYSTYKDGGYATGSGTSMASPHAAGLAALYIAVNGRADNATEVHAIRQALIDDGVAQDSLQGLATLNDPDGNRENIGWAGPLGPMDYPPTVSITYPGDGATVSGTVVVTADASDDNSVTQVEFFVDDSTIDVDFDGSDGWSTSWDTTTVSDGSYKVTATATDDVLQTSSDSINVTVDNEDDAPTVTITSPADAATVSGTIDVTADATDDKGVTKAEFFVDGTTKIGEATTAPYAISWDTATVVDGPHTITATATDTIGQTASDSISVTVDNTAPTVNITSPTEGATVSGTIDVTADASDATSGVAQVEFFVDDASIGVDTTAPYAVSWNTTTATNGSHTLQAVATDDSEQSTESALVNVTVDNPVATTMHVGNLDGTNTDQGRSWSATVTITVHDASHNLLADATVSGTWIGGYSGTDSCTTDSSGQCSVISGSIPKRNGSVTFTVDGVTHATLSYEYEPADNHDPDGDSDGTSITVFKP